MKKIFIKQPFSLMNAWLSMASSTRPLSFSTLSVHCFLRSSKWSTEAWFEGLFNTIRAAFTTCGTRSSTCLCGWSFKSPILMQFCHPLQQILKYQQPTLCADPCISSMVLLSWQVPALASCLAVELILCPCWAKLLAFSSKFSSLLGVPG